MRDTIIDVTSGKLEGRWDVGPGWWKTYMSQSLMHHVVQNDWRVLYLTPGNTELNNAIDSHLDKYKLWENNFIKFEQESDITCIKDSKYKKLYDSVPYHYGTIQMMIYDKRYKHIPVDYYDLIVYDESQGFLGDIYSSTMKYFLGMGLYISATPFNNTKHLWSIIPHRYGEITSEFLEQKHGFPEPEIISCNVEEWNGIYANIEPYDDFDFEKNETYRSMINISERFRISEAIYEEIILSGDRKGIDFMPTVDDAEIFVKYIVPNNPILKGNVDFVAGRREKKKNKEIEAKLRSGELKVVLCKDLWNRSLDIKDITDIILNDPTCSEERLIQRIGRGRRKSPGKHTFRVWDIISSVFHSKKIGKSALSANDVVWTSTKTQTRPKSITAWPRELSPEFIAALQKRRVNNLIELTKNEIQFRENLRQAYFLWDISMANEVFLHFATEVFHVHPHELKKNWNYYLKEKSYLDIDFQGETVRLNFQDFSDALKFYRSYWYVAQYDWLKDISESIIWKNTNDFQRKTYTLRTNSLSKIEDILIAQDISQWNIELYKGKTDHRYMSELYLYLQRNKGNIKWIDRHYRVNNMTESRFSFIIEISLFGKVSKYDTGKFAVSKKDAKHFIAQEIYTKHLEQKLREQKNSTGISNKKKELENFLTTIGWTKKYIHTEKNEKMHIKHILEVQVWKDTYWYKDGLYFPTTLQAKQHLTEMALKELQEKYKNTPKQVPQQWKVSPDKKSKEKKSSISLIVELMQKNKWTYETYESQIWKNTEWVALFASEIVITLRGEKYIFSSKWDFTTKQTAKENAAKKAYEKLKNSLLTIEEFLISKDSYTQNPYMVLSEILKKINSWYQLQAQDIYIMRDLERWSKKLSHWWLLLYMYRRWLISAPKIIERTGYIFISIDGRNMWSCAKEKYQKNKSFSTIKTHGKEVESASKISINKLLLVESIQDYFISKLKKQISRELEISPNL